MNTSELQAIIDDQHAAIQVLTKEVEDYCRVLEYASNKPGLAEQLEVARLYPGVFKETLSLVELVELCGVDASDKEMKYISTAMVMCYGVQCHKEPETHYYYIEDGTQVCSELYPSDMIPVLRSILQMLGLLEFPLKLN